MRLSPDMREKLRKFRRNRRAHVSLLTLTVLFLLSLPAELLLNDRPLLLVVNGRWYAPFARTYTPRDFGGASDIPIADYRAPRFLDLLEGRVHTVDPVTVFGDDDETGDLTVAAPAATPAPAPTAAPAAPRPTYRFFWAPIRHSYKSNTVNPRCGRENLAAPWSTTDPVTHERYPGAVVDGHLLGTDAEGKDVLARLVYGFRISLLFGLGLALSATLVGCTLGAIQGFFGGWVDLCGQRLTEIWGSLPQLFLLIILSSFLSTRRELSPSQHFLLLFGILNLTAWMGMSTYMRAEFLKARNLEYVKAARALGVSNVKTMLHHILPNALTPVITFFPFSITGGILALVSLDFLALGVRYPAPSLGELLAQGQANLHAVWILVPTFCVLAVSLTLLTFIGDGVRNAFDPRVR